MSMVTNTISNNNGIIILCSVDIVEGYFRKFREANKRENILYFHKMCKQSPTKVPKVILYMYTVHAKQMEHFPQKQRTERKRKKIKAKKTHKAPNDGLC